MGTIYPGVKCPPPNHHVCFQFYVMIKGTDNFSYLVPMITVNGVGGGEGEGQSTPPHKPSCMLSFLCNDQRD